MDNKNIVFVDLEADTVEKDSYLLQIGAIKIDENGNEETFNTFCYKKTIQTRISNLLGKPKNFFDNPNYPKEKEALDQFKIFSKGCTIYSYGNFDSIIIKRVKNRLKTNIELNVIDIQSKITKLMLSKRPIALSQLSIALNIKFDNKHDGLEDATLLKEVYLMVNSDNFDANKTIEKINHIKYLPKQTSSEFIGLKFQNKNDNKLTDKFKSIFILHKNKTINIKNEMQILNDEDDSLYVSDSLKETIVSYSQESIQKNDFTFIMFDENQKLVSIEKTSIDFDKKSNKLIYDDICNKYFNNLNNVIYITNSVRIINDYSYNKNMFLSYVNIGNTSESKTIFKNAKLLEQENNPKQLLEIMNKIKQAINSFN